jgi:acetylornithine/LysW-gamma-L-lysine aminotransferase
MTHGSTFGGNPLACAAALATLEVMTGEYSWSRDQNPKGLSLPARAGRLGSSLIERLKAINSSVIREVRGLGLLVGVDLRVKVTPILQRLQSLGVLALPAGSTVLRLLPPLVIEEEDLARVVEAVELVLQESGVRGQGSGTVS